MFSDCELPDKLITVILDIEFEAFRHKHRGASGGLGALYGAPFGRAFSHKNAATAFFTRANYPKPIAVPSNEKEGN